MEKGEVSCAEEGGGGGLNASTSLSSKTTT